MAICQGRQGNLLQLTQRNRFFQGQEVDILQPGKPSFTATLDRIYNQDREPIDVAPHAEMTVFWETDVQVEEGAYLRIKKN